MDENMGLISCEGEGPKLARSQSPMDNLKRKKLNLEESLSNVNAAIQALEDHPEVTKVLELLAKTR